jgi:hypothetical protein
MSTEVEITEAPFNPSDRTASIYSVTVGGQRLEGAAFTRAEAEDMAARHLAGQAQPDDEQGQDQLPDAPTRRKRAGRKATKESRDAD